jgi:HPr kinase/phosphorylase
MTAGAEPRCLAIHATAVLAGEAGLLIRGASGAGKTALALGIVAEGLPDGVGGRLAGRLVADDRVLLSRIGGGPLVARPHPLIAGQAELRGTGIVRLPSAAAAVLRGVIDLVDLKEISRLPDDGETTVCLLGVPLPLLRLAAGPAAHVALARAWPIFQQQMRNLMTI